MDLLGFFRSLDELLYEVVSWLLFFPRTLWRMVSAPLTTMAHAGRELREAERKQFDDMIPPPLFLLVTLILVHLIELGVYGQSNMVSTNPRLSKMIGSDVNVTIFRILVFSILPLAAAVRLANARGEPLDRPTLKPAFYAQCYVAAVFALVFALSILFGRGEKLLDDVGFVLLAAAGVIWLYVVEARWFAIQLGTSLATGFRNATSLILQWIAIMIGVMFVVRWG